MGLHEAQQQQQRGGSGGGVVMRGAMEREEEAMGVDHHRQQQQQKRLDYHYQRFNDEEFEMYRRYLKGIYHRPSLVAASSASSSSSGMMLVEESEGSRSGAGGVGVSPLPILRPYVRGPTPLPDEGERMRMMMMEQAYHQQHHHHHPPPFPPPSRNVVLGTAGVTALASSVYKAIQNTKSKRRRRTHRLDNDDEEVVALTGPESWKARVSQSPDWSPLHRYRFIASLGKGSHAETFLVERNGITYVLKESELLPEVCRLVCGYTWDG